MPSALLPLAVPGGPAVLDLLPHFERALAGTTPLLPYADGGTPPEHADPQPGELDGVGLVVGTSGSTGSPKLAMLTADALRASGSATHEHLGGPGRWLLAMPATHIAGVQVLLRSLLAGNVPVVLPDGPFTSASFVDAVAAMTGPRRYSAVVPTQLSRLLDDEAGTEAAAALDGILVGGAGTPPALLARARAAGVTAVTTYGMSETAGGCVYDGVPLSCSLIRTDDEGRLHLGGDTLARGYLGRPDLTAQHFFPAQHFPYAPHVTYAPPPAPGNDALRVRDTWFRTDDAGHQDADGRWHVDGRLDDLITTGGLKVAPRLVEEALAAHVQGVLDAVVVGVPDPEWGQSVGAALVLREGSPTPPLTEVRDLLRPALPAYALPRRLVVLDRLPLRGPGKPDRRALAEMLASRDRP